MLNRSNVQFSKLHAFLAVSFVSLYSVNLYAEGAGNTGGQCYNLQMIALKSKTADMTNTNGHSIFIAQNAKTKILLSEGPFDVIDRNGTDGTASFSLPNPDPTNSGNTEYSVFMRLVGKPGSKIDMVTCGESADGSVYCSQDSISMSRLKGRSSFQNVSQELLYIYADINGDGVIDRIPLFSSELQDYFWEVDSQGRSHAQLRFCPVSTTVASP